LGPLQLYVVPPEALTVIVPAVPQYGPVLVAPAVGKGLIVTTMGVLALSQPVCVWVT
jgi:hypothetical protein